MSLRSIADVKEEIQSLEDLEAERCIADSFKDEYTVKLANLQLLLSLLEKIEELENMDDYGRGSPVDRFEDSLDEGEWICIGVSQFCPSKVLKNMDPVGYHETYLGWADGEIRDLEDIINEIPNVD